MNARTAKLCNRFASFTKRRPRWVKRVWNDTPRALRPELRAAMLDDLKHEPTNTQPSPAAG